MTSTILKEREADSGTDSSEEKSVRISDRGSDNGETEEKVVEKSPKGRFHRFNRKLGSGAFKTVYLAFDNDTGREVAWNVISFARLKRHERKRIDDEIIIAKSLDHPRIMRFINAWINKEKSEVIFITERVTGGSLRQYINRLDGPLKLKVIRNWCRQILEGVVYLHSQPHPVIHRDLKCDNIFVNGNDGKVLIGDLGLSTTLRAESVATSIVGTPEFMAPELYEEKYGPAVDIYAFGMCLLEMVTRKFPYSECTTAGQIYKKVISGEPPRALHRVKDASLKEIIERCIAINPDTRPTSEELLNDKYWSVQEDGDNYAELEPDAESTPHSQGAVAVENVPARLSVAHPPKKTLTPESPEKAPAPKAPEPPSADLILLNDDFHSDTAAAHATDIDDLTDRQSTSLLDDFPPPSAQGPVEDEPSHWASPTRETVEALPNFSQIEAACRYMEIKRLERVQMIVEVTQGVRHGVRFDFSLATDTPVAIARELREAGLVWSGISEAELVKLVQASLQERLQEVAAERRLLASSAAASSSASSIRQPAPLDLLSDDVVRPSNVPPSPPGQEWRFQGLSEELCAHLKSPVQAAAEASATVLHPPVHRPGGIASAEDVLALQGMLQVLLLKPASNFLSGVFCHATTEALKEFQTRIGMEPTGFVSDRTWTNLAEQIDVKRKKEEEKLLKREEAKAKAKQVCLFILLILFFRKTRGSCCSSRKRVQRLWTISWRRRSTRSG
jgi:serine/threonine protein kinase